MKVLVTCPPMLQSKDHFLPLMAAKGLEPVCPEVTQTLSEERLIELLPDMDGWIIGDDPASERVLQEASKGALKAAVKWGAGTDNVDFAAFQAVGIPVVNTPGMFGNEVADMALAYTICLARDLFAIDRQIREGGWPKYQGMSLAESVVGVVGYGDIGAKTAKRFSGIGANVIVWDPYVTEVDSKLICFERNWPNRIEDCDFLVFTCALTDSNRHMLSSKIINKCKTGVKIVNVARGGLIDEAALEMALESQKVAAVALDVFEVEPLPLSSSLRNHPLSILGTHNSSNTLEAVRRTNARAIDLLAKLLLVDGS